MHSSPPLNEELQSTNEELETMNDELRDRTDETLHANAFLGSVLSSIQQGVVVVDRTLRVVAWSQCATDLWGCGTTRSKASISSTSTSALRCQGCATRFGRCSPARRSKSSSWKATTGGAKPPASS